MTPSEVLLAAADRIQSHGWTKGYMALDIEGKPIALSPARACNNDRVRQTCVVGAIRMADPDGSDEAKHVLRKHLGLKSLYDLPTWNDDPLRTEQQIVTALREAAK